MALKRAAAMADGFIFADGGADAFEQMTTLRTYLDEAHRSVQEFGLHINMLRAKTSAAIVETVSRWRDVGGTHASIVTMGQNFTSTDEHVNFLQKAADALRTAGLLGT